jgi:hypothetical protein
VETQGTPGGAEKHYAFFLVRWGAETWMATVVQDDSPVLIVENEEVVTTVPSGLTVERAIELATERRDAVIALRRRSRGRPDVVHTVIEPSGDPARMDERLRRTPPVVQPAIPRWLVALAGLEVGVAAVLALGVRPFGPRHVVVLTLVFGTLAAFLACELRARRGATSPGRDETPSPDELRRVAQAPPRTRRGPGSR